jgi:hypothetical protein
VDLSLTHVVKRVFVCLSFVVVDDDAAATLLLIKSQSSIRIFDTEEEE